MLFCLQITQGQLEWQQKFACVQGHATGININFDTIVEPLGHRGCGREVGAGGEAVSGFDILQKNAQISPDR